RADESAPRGPGRDPGARGSRGPRGGGGAPQAGGRALEGALSLPSGKDALLHRSPEAQPLPLLRVPRGRGRLRVPAPARSPGLPRGRAAPGRARGGAAGEASARDGLLALTEWAARRFEAWLWDGAAAERALAYLDGRGIGRET